MRAEIDRHRTMVPRGAHSVLSSRTLANSHRRLSEVLRRGMAVLDVGCGTGAITAGIAGVVGGAGRVVGVDADGSLIAEARRSHRRDRLTFEVRDVYDLGFTGEFDVRFEPPAPPTAARFYDAFLKWRSGAGMSNVIADLLGDRFREAGLGSVAVTPQHEVTSRGDGDFDEQILLWAKVAASRGVQMVADGYLTEAERALAEKQFRQWTADSAIHQRLYLLGIEGLVPQAAGMRPWWPKLRLLRSAHAR